MVLLPSWPVQRDWKSPRYGWSACSSRWSIHDGERHFLVPEPRQVEQLHRGGLPVGTEGEPVVFTGRVGSGHDAHFPDLLQAKVLGPDEDRGAGAEVQVAGEERSAERRVG